MATTNDTNKTPRIDERIHIDTRLDPIKDDKLLQEIWELKRKPRRGEPTKWSYVQTYRDAFKLILSLRRGDVTVLVQMFPWIVDRPLNQKQLNSILNPLVARLMDDPFIAPDSDYHYKDAIE